jgi:hypothetical protein
MRLSQEQLAEALDVAVGFAAYVGRVIVINGFRLREDLWGSEQASLEIWTTATRMRTRTTSSTPRRAAWS